MNDDYENVEWNVHATTDVYTPLAEAQDPLTALSNSYDAKTFTQEVACYKTRQRLYYLCS